MKKINLFVGRLQPATQGHINCINEGDAPCIIYRMNSSNKKIEVKKNKSIKIGSKSYSKDTVLRVIEYIDNPTGNLTDQEKELLKRPFTNELIDIVGALQLYMYKKFAKFQYLVNFNKNNGDYICFNNNNIDNIEDVLKHCKFQPIGSGGTRESACRIGIRKT